MKLYEVIRQFITFFFPPTVVNQNNILFDWLTLLLTIVVVLGFAFTLLGLLGLRGDKK